MRLPHHLLKSKTGIWSFRLIVPADLHLYFGKKVIKRTLGTLHPAKARAYAYELGAQYARAIAQARGFAGENGRMSSSTNGPGRYSGFEIRQHEDGGYSVSTDGTPGDNSAALEALRVLERMSPQGVVTQMGETVRQIRATSSPVRTRRQADRLESRGRRRRRQAPMPAPDEVRDARERGDALGEQADLADRVVAAMPPPLISTWPAYVKILAVLRRMRRAMLLLTRLVDRHHGAAQDVRRTTLAHWYGGFDLRDAHHRLADAHKAVDRWQKTRRSRFRWRASKAVPSGPERFRTPATGGAADWAAQRSVG